MRLFSTSNILKLSDQQIIFWVLYKQYVQYSSIVTLPCNRIISYQPFDFLLRYVNDGSSKGFVRMSAVCSFVLIYLILRSLLGPFVKDLNQWYFRLMCLVLGVNLWVPAIVMQDVLSSYRVHWKSVSFIPNCNAVFNSFRRFINGMISLVDWLRAMYSASSVESAISVWSLEVHVTGHP